MGFYRIFLGSLLLTSNLLSTQVRAAPACPAPPAPHSEPAGQGSEGSTLVSPGYSPIQSEPQALPSSLSTIISRDAPSATSSASSYSSVASLPSTSPLQPAESSISQPAEPRASYPAATSYWLETIERSGAPAFGTAGYQVFRNVKDFGAVGDGTTDDTDAINQAIATGARCGLGCDSSTTTPAIVYFPAGTYLVRRPLIQYYYTQLIGDARNKPVLKAAPDFQGMAVIDANPYTDQGTNWFTNQNNFFRQVRNFVIDLTSVPFTTGTGIHWQVAQATSLQNIVFNMRTDGGDGNVQQGIFMENGSGGFMTNLTFNGGKYGAFLGSQQFTTRNLVFNGCRTALFMNWNWAWTFHGLNINNCDIGIDMANGGVTQTVGSVLLLDSTIANTRIAVTTSYDPSSPQTNGTLVIENVDMTANVPTAVQNVQTNTALLAGNQNIASWAQGRAYVGLGGGSAVQGAQAPVSRPGELVDTNGRFVARDKPQYEDVDVSRFISVKKSGAVGDGNTDDTAAVQAVFDQWQPGEVVYFDHGAYKITSTLRVPKDIKITGEIWPLILAGGDSFFKNQDDPKPLFQVGEPGDVGTVEMSDLMIETQGAQPGAILMEWNVESATQGAAGLWDVHFRVGGSAGTQLQSDKCKKTPEVTTQVNPECIGAFMLLHLTPESSGYFENTWFWVSDHELDRPDFSQINIYNGRGVLIESTKGTWLWGTASEHNVLYNYQMKNAANVFVGHIQTETAYFQGNPDSRVPFTVQPSLADPDFSASCSGANASPRCARTWGVRVLSSRDILFYGAGLYSFFDNYQQTCVASQDCQDHMVDIQDSSQVRFVGLSTKAAVNMVSIGGQSAALDQDNRNNFCATVALFSSE